MAHALLGSLAGVPGAEPVMLIGKRWRPGLDVVNLGLLVLGALALYALWAGGTIQRWVPAPWYQAIRGSVTILLGIVLMLDVVGGFHDLSDGIRRGSQNRSNERPGEEPRGER